MKSILIYISSPSAVASRNKRTIIQPSKCAIISRTSSSLNDRNRLKTSKPPLTHTFHPLNPSSSFIFGDSHKQKAKNESERYNSPTIQTHTYTKRLRSNPQSKSLWKISEANPSFFIYWLLKPINEISLSFSAAEGSGRWRRFNEFFVRGFGEISLLRKLHRTPANVLRCALDVRRAHAQ